MIFQVFYWNFGFSKFHKFSRIQCLSLNRSHQKFQKFHTSREINHNNLHNNLIVFCHLLPSVPSFSLSPQSWKVIFVSRPSLSVNCEFLTFLLIQLFFFLWCFEFSVISSKEYGIRFVEHQLSATLILRKKWGNSKI